jgi:hypothetical protein
VQEGQAGVQKDEGFPLSEEREKNFRKGEKPELKDGMYRKDMQTETAERK